MDNLQSPSPIQPAAEGFQAQIDGVRHLLVSILILMVVISGTLNIYLLRQWRSISKDLGVVRPQAAQMINEYQKGAPLMNDFLKKVTDYGRANPDFAPILAKYGIKPNATGAPPVGTTSPLPATAPKK